MTMNGKGASILAHPSGRSIHDNNIYAYSVLCERRRIVLHTEFRDGGREEYTDVIFAGVVVHHFETALQSNILFGIEEMRPEKIVLGWADSFERGKNYRWPEIEYQNPKQLISTLKAQGVKGYEISSSYGLGGWVLAAGMDLSAREAKSGQDVEPGPR